LHLLAGAAYDPISNRMMVFGGASGGPFSDLNTVRVLIDANGVGDPRWVDLAPAGVLPPPRSQLQNLVYDPTSNRLIIFGGYRWAGNTEYNDVWVLSNANGLGGIPEWQQLVPSGTPPSGRQSLPIFWDPNTNRLILFGGLNQFSEHLTYDDSWVLTHANGVGGPPQWIKLQPSGSLPVGRRHYAGSYNTRTNRLVTGFGQHDVMGADGLSITSSTFDDTWVLANASGNCTVGQPCTFKATASDPDVGDALTYSLDAAPAGMTIDVASGAIVWMLAIAQIGNHVVTVRATDRGGLFATQTFTATVAPVAVPNVVGLAPEWAESFIAAADLTVGTKTSQGGAITLNFDSLPSRQGWAYLGSATPEVNFYAVSSGVLLQNTLAAGSDAPHYEFRNSVGPRHPFRMDFRARVLESVPDEAHWGFDAAVFTGREEFEIGVSTRFLRDNGKPFTMPFNATDYHDFSMRGTPGAGYMLSSDGLIIAEGSRQAVVYPASVYFGDGTTGQNARAEISALSFTQPRVVGQNPPAGTLVPNKTAVDLTIVDGPTTETVPNVIGLSQPAAEAAIVTANLKLGGITSAPHPTIPAGQVSDQSPLPNIHVPKDTPVTIVISTGPPGPINLPPVITSAPLLTATASQPYGYQVTATDPDAGDVLTYSLTTAPIGMTINAASGLIAWTPGVGQMGNQKVSVRVTDQGGLPATQDFEIAVGAPNHPPVITYAGLAPQWTQLAPGGTPPTPRSHIGSAYDAINDRMIVFGGVTPGDVKTNDVWVLINATGRAGAAEWTKLAPSGAAPAARAISIVAYDPTANRLIIHGGCPANCGTAFVDTWVLTHANGLGGAPEWIQLPSGTSDLTAGHAYDPISNCLMLFAGSTPAAPFNDTSAVRVLVDANGIGEPRWIDLSPLGTRPPPRSELYALGYDGVNNRLLVFGGYRWRDIDYNDVWVLKNANGLGGAPEWQQLSPDGTAPDARATMPLHYDPNSNRLIVFGGLRQSAAPDVVFDETWVLSNANGVGGTPQWTRLASTAPGPGPRRSHATVYDPRSNRLVAGLGYNDLNGQTFNDAWVLSSASGVCTAGQPCTFKASATDPDAGDALTYALDAAPPGMTIDPASGAMPWTPAIAQIGNHTVTVRVTDRGGLFATQTFTATVAPVAVPNVVGLAPEWAELFITAADLTAGTKTSQGGAITLNFDSLPSRQGWTYWPLNNPALEADVFSVSGGTLFQNSLGTGFQGQGSNQYNFHDVVGDRLPMQIALRARVLEEEGDVARNSYGFSFGEHRGSRSMSNGLGTAQIMDQTWPLARFPYDNTSFHQYRLEARPGLGSRLIIDDTLAGTGPDVTNVFRNLLFLGDGTGGTNARAEVTAYSFTQPRVVGQNPPAGTLVPNKTAVDLTIVDGPATETVPHLISLSQPAAEAAIVTANLKLGGITSAPHPTIPAGQVSDQSPLPNIHVPKDMPVAIVISTGPPGPVNQAPSFTSTPVLAALAGSPYAYPVTASDPNLGDTLTFSLPTAPAGMTIDASTGLITWTPTLGQVGNTGVTVRVTDAGGLTAEQAFTIAVSPPAPVNLPPSITSTPVTTATADAPYGYDLEATDPNPGDTLTWSLITAPAGMTIDPATGLIQWTPSAAQAGDHPVEAKVQDAGGLFVTQTYTLTVNAAAVCVPPPPGLVSWWAGEGSALDRAAANDGLAESGADFAAGLVGQAFRFDGVDDLIRIASSRTVSFGGPFSVEFWFNPTTTIDTSTPNQVLLAKGRYSEGGFNAPVAIQVLGGDGRLLVRMPPAPALISTTDTWPAGTWQHLALSWDGARYRLYINGVEEAQLDNAFSIIASTDPITLGHADGFAAAGFAGLLDEPTLYNRALTPAEIAALHAARALGKCTAGHSRADAGADQTVEVSQTVTLDGSASRAFDTAQLAYQWTLTTRPADSAAVLANPTSVSPSFIADQAGSYTLDLIVSNAGHASAPDSVTITAARVNHPPAITSTPLTAATPGSAYTYPVAASDPDAGDTLAFSLPVAPAGMSINPASGLIQWTPNAGQIGSHNVSVRAQDLGGLFDVQSFLIVVVAAPVPVTVPDVVGQEQTAAQNSLSAASLTVGAVTLASSDTVPAGRVISQNPAAGAVVNSGSAVALVVSSGPPGPVLASIRVTPINGLILTGQTQAFAATGILSNGSSLPLTGVAWASSNPAVATIDAAGLVTALAEGNTTISAAKDGVSGNTSFNVAQAVAENTLPVAQISAPADGASIASAVPVVGTASDAHFLKYVIEIAPFETGVFSTLHVGTAPVTNGTLATLDPTTLLNDLYVVRLTVIDKADNRTQTEITVQLTRDKKVGNFTLAFQDVNVPMAGIPISVVRSYDSRDKTRGDFGIGWRLDVQSLRLRVVGIHGQGWEQTRSGGVLNRRYTISPTRVHKVAITLPDGKVEEFDMGVAPSTQQFAPIQVVDAVYTPKAQTRGSLRALGETRLVTFGQTGGFDLLTESGLEIFDPQEFEYTTPEGQVILLSRTAGVQQIRDRSGNTVSFTPGGITHSAGKSIVFTRDAQSRITTVTDPQGNFQIYAYDINGDLASHTDAEGRRTNYLYNYDHGLIEIQDPRGIRPIRNDYDDAGRLIRTTDAYGKAITYTHDLGANREVITDRLGHATIHVYDDLGNVTQTADALGGVTNRSYDGRGNTLSEQDPLGRTRTTTYDGQDNRLSETDPLGKTTTYTYNGTRQVLTVTDALGRTTSNAYDAAGNLTSTTDPAGQVTSYTYDARGQQLTRTDPLGHLTQYAYDAAGNLVSETDPLGRATSYTYDANGNRLTQTTSRTTAGGPETLLTAFVYDRANRLTQTTHPDGSVTRVAYNAIGKQSITTDPLGRETRFDYDDMGRLIRTTYPNGSSESSTYDAEGRRIGSTDRAGRTTTSTYDALGRLIETIAPDNSRTSTVYDAAGQVLTSTDARGNVTTYVYDGAGRRTQVIDALGQATTFSYDDLGNQTRVTDANGNAVAFTYDANNRRTRTTYADSTVEQVSYDALGRQTAKTDQAGKTTQYAYDALSRLIRVTDALGQITSYSYDEQGNQLTQTDAEGRTTTFAYDKMGRRTQRTLPLGQSEAFTYDTAGNLRTKADFNGRTTSYAYDNVNRLLRKTPDASLGQPPVIFTYTPSGQRASMQDASGSTTYSYDSRDRLLSKATPQGTLSYSYDPAGNLTNIHSNHAGGAAMDYTYDQRNRLAAVTDANGTTTYSYDAVGNLAGFLYPNGVQTTYTYNPLNRLTNVTGARGATLASYTYTLGPSGNRTAVTEASGRRVDYTYDDLYRLKSETISADPAGPNGAIAYTYDRVGNRLTRISTVAVIPDQSFEYDFNDRLGGEGYDSNGNTLTSGGRTFGYDFENHLTSADGGVSFVYNGDGIRVAKTAGGVTTGFLVDDRNPTRYAQVLEEVVGGAVERSYTYGLKLISQKQASGVNFYGYDGHGSVRYLTDAGGNVTDTYSYEAFGNLVTRVGGTANQFRYSSEQFDSDIFAYYLRSRWYGVPYGRFTTLDSFEGDVALPSSLHKYTYTASNPTNHQDPSGRFFLVDVLIQNALINSVLKNQNLIKGAATLHSAQQKVIYANTALEIVYGALFPRKYGVGKVGWEINLNRASLGRIPFKFLYTGSALSPLLWPSGGTEREFKIEHANGHFFAVKLDPNGQVTFDGALSVGWVLIGPNPAVEVPLVEHLGVSYKLEFAADGASINSNWTATFKAQFLGRAEIEIASYKLGTNHIEWFFE
jgi:RHS repeat-associated protein